MSCDRVTQVHAYHDDALAAPDRVAIEAHLEHCADCSALLADLRGLTSLIGAAPLKPMSPETSARLVNHWRAVRDRGVLRITGWLTAAAAAILIGAPLLFPDRSAAPEPIAVSALNGDAVWETVAVMPPTLEADENVPELIVLAQWMANDLSPNDFSAGERQ